MAADGSCHSYPGSTASSLIQAIKDEDPQGWERLVRLYGVLVYKWCRQAGLAREDSADIVQEVFQSIHRGIASFQRKLPSRSFRTWIRAITTNKIRDLARRNARHVGAAIGGSDAQAFLDRLAAEATSTSGSWAKSAASIARGTLLNEALETVATEFAPRTWQAFWRTAIDDQLPADVALDLGMSPGAVHTAKWRVLKRLREYLQGIGQKGNGQDNARPKDV